MSGLGEGVTKCSTTKTPSDFLKFTHGKPVVVKLNFGVDYRGYSFSLIICVSRIVSVNPNFINNSNLKMLLYDMIQF